MKRVIIVRHAKSVPYGYDDDFNRDLSDRGKSDAKKVGNVLVSKGIVPQAMISSPAKRALKTARIFAEALGFDKNKIVEVQDIYDGLTTSEFLGLINQLPENVDTVLFFGHNPGFHYFVNNLLVHFSDDMPTCSTVGIDFEVESWSQVQARKGVKAFHFVPKIIS